MASGAVFDVSVLHCADEMFDRGVHTEFFIQLADQAGFHSFAGLDMASRQEGPRAIALAD
ncbi:hypothetical protein GCM10025762_36220 [Haloechinothrix salitolerans]